MKLIFVTFVNLIYIGDTGTYNTITGVTTTRKEYILTPFKRYKQL